MKKIIKNYELIQKSLLAVMALLMFLMGCSQMDTSTSPQSDATQEMWNPQPGDQIIPGHEVPILEEGYWENQNGADINPSNAFSARLILPLIGGRVTLGNHSYYIPPRALSLSIIATLANASRTGVAVDCGPSPLDFLLPVTLTLSYRGTQYENMDSAPDLHIFYAAPDGSYQMLESTVDHVNKTVTAQTIHFSRYIIG